MKRLFAEAGTREYTFDRIFQLVQPRSVEALAAALEQLSRAGIVHRVYRVESPSTHVGIGDYDSITDIPNRLYDRSADEELEVDPKSIRPIFRTA